MKTGIASTLIIMLLLSSLCAFSQHAPFASFYATADSYVSFGDGQNMNCINDLSNGNKVTICMWVRWGSKSATGVGSWANLFTLTDSTGNGDNGVFWVQHSSGNTNFEFALHTTGRSYIQSTTNPTEGTWYFLAMVYDGSLPNNNMKLYVNGVLEATQNKTGNIRAMPNATRLNMGRWPNPGNNYRRFNGSLDEISLWNKALTLAEIQSLRVNPESVTGVSYNNINLIGYWNFDNYNANDLSICANNGSLGGGVELPVIFGEMYAVQNVNQVDLSWVTLSEIENDYFVVEKSSDGINFFDAGIVSGSGNSNSPVFYTYTDSDPVSGTNYYRLKQVDFNGEFSYSELIAASYVHSFPGKLMIYPNPACRSGEIIIQNHLKGYCRNITICNMQGQKMFESAYIPVIKLNLPESGIYVIHFTGDNEPVTLRLMIF